jgi:hypothetical protein
MLSSFDYAARHDHCDSTFILSSLVMILRVSKSNHRRLVRLPTCIDVLIFKCQPSNSGELMSTMVSTFYESSLSRWRMHPPLRLCPQYRLSCWVARYWPLTTSPWEIYLCLTRKWQMSTFESILTGMRIDSTTALRGNYPNVVRRMSLGLQRGPDGSQMSARVVHFAIG